MPRRYYRGRPPRRRSLRPLNYIPRRGLYCVSKEKRHHEGMFTPLACFETFQEALEADTDDIPPTQGLTTRHEVPRTILCDGQSVIYNRPDLQREDGRAIWQIIECRNYTTRPGPRGREIDIPDSELANPATDLVFGKSWGDFLLGGLIGSVVLYLIRGR